MQLQQNKLPLFKLVKEASCQKPPVCETLLDLDGNVITACEELSLCQSKHLLELFNRNAAPVTIDASTGNGDSPPYDYNLDVPTVAEIEAVVHGLKNCKAAGADCLLPVLFKSSLEAICPWLQRVISGVWESKVVHAE